SLMGPTYVPLASLYVSLALPAAQWRLDGGAWQSFPSSLGNLSLGTHTVEFSPVEGYITPASQTVTLVSGPNSLMGPTYVPLASLYVSLALPAAQWRLDGGAWQSFPTALNNLSLGIHTVEFSPVEGYITPASQTVTLVSGPNSLMGPTYVQLASLYVSLSPTSGQWRLDGGAWQTFPASLNNLGLGNHTIEFSDIEGYVTPPLETVTLTSGMNSLSRSYAVLGNASLHVVLDPAQAQWRIDSGAWLPSGASVTNLTAGNHWIEFMDVSGYTAPPAQTITLAANATENLTFTYAEEVPLYEVVANFPDAGYRSNIIKGSDGVFYGISAYGGGMGSGTLFKINADGSNHTLLRNFGGTTVGHTPAALIEGTDGMLYGTTTNGGPANGGTVFKVNKNGTGYAALHVFSATTFGLYPNTLIEGSDGLLYGTTTGGGGQNLGVIFKLTKSGTGFTMLRSFSGGTDGKTLMGLVEGTSGALYGSAAASGGTGFGVIFKINKDGSLFSVVKTFAGGADGATPRGPLLSGSDGFIYGTTYTGGAFNRGTLFRLNADGTGHTILKNFKGDGIEAGAPMASLKEDEAGILYGTTAVGGPGGRGAVFKLNKNGSGFAQLKTFSGGTADGAIFPFQTSPLSIGNGVLHGLVWSGGLGGEGLFFKVNTDGGNFSVLKQMGSPGGSFILTSVTDGSDGALYGTSLLGGTDNNGLVYRINKDGSGHAVLRSFTKSEGQKFAQGVLETTGGALFVCIGDNLVRMNKDGSGQTIVYNFPALTYLEGVIEGSNGVLYGTSGGGAFGFGEIFKINPDGSGYGVVRSFTGGTADGKFPTLLREGPNGNLYGMTNGGGTADRGIIFTVKKDGTGYAILKHLTGGADGGSPRAQLTVGADGLLYGTTVVGGANNQGVIFKMALNGTGYTVLHNFLMPVPTDRNETYAGVVEKNGALYGVTFFGGTFGYGTVFTLGTDGTGYTTLVNFSGLENDGAIPAAGLVLGRDGLLYGTTARGLEGATIFRVRTD
ncbi:MAG TPA: choice-of-anchor tandem repeat GloVer-containing protein, partial [Opitutaceae bacterium]|nr:choice-of-anchor tandem repeat GloVer-containing protein [Opitutaceae bacterium]